MGSTKIVVLVLVLVAVLFIVFVIYGAGKNASVETTGDSKKDAQEFNPKQYPRLEKLGSLFGSHGPQLEPKQMKPPQTTFDLRSKPQYEIEVSPDDDHKFRKAKFRITQGQHGCVMISYKAEGNVDKNLEEQNWPSDNGPEEDGKVTFWILKTGGRLIFSRSNPTFSGPCTVQLE